ncbi:hypothetical protein VPH35_122801 [Triticum aestivum]
MASRACEKRTPESLLGAFLSCSVSALRAWMRRMSWERDTAQWASLCPLFCSPAPLSLSPFLFLPFFFSFIFVLLTAGIRYYSLTKKLYIVLVLLFFHKILI